MIKVVLGSTSEDKKSIVSDFFSSMDKDVKISLQEVASGVPDQPMDEEITIIGATNRAKNALNLQPTDMAIGIEGGLCNVDDELFLVCIIAVIEPNGKISIGKSSKYMIPNTCAKQVASGKPFGEMIREYYKSCPDNEKGYVDDLINRKKAFTEALYKAFSNSSF